MISKGNKLYSILGSKCPKCHGESMYKSSNPFNIARIYDMHERCSICGTKYKIEPSFFYGAMYVSYALGVAIAVAAFITSKFILGSSVMTGFISIIAAVVLFMPLNMRLARNIWINFFIQYDPETAKSKATQTDQ
jgi:uncharacterized protein (DUF983 family)